MEFEFDRSKSDANRRKHGVGFDHAVQIWQEAYLELTARTVDEPRFLVIGKIRDKLYSCIYTTRGERIRLISCRRARGKEGQLYHEHFKKGEVSEGS